MRSARSGPSARPSSPYASSPYGNDVSGFLTTCPASPPLGALPGRADAALTRGAPWRRYQHAAPTARWEWEGKKSWARTQHERAPGGPWLAGRTGAAGRSGRGGRAMTTDPASATGPVPAADEAVEAESPPSSTAPGPGRRRGRRRLPSPRARSPSASPAPGRGREPPSVLRARTEGCGGAGVPLTRTMQRRVSVSFMRAAR